jgi:hypothetical protein
MIPFVDKVASVLDADDVAQLSAMEDNDIRARYMAVKMFEDIYPAIQARLNVREIDEIEWYELFRNITIKPDWFSHRSEDIYPIAKDLQSLAYSAGRERK